MLMNRQRSLFASCWSAFLLVGQPLAMNPCDYAPQRSEAIMELARQKEVATTFLHALDKLDPASLGNLIADNFEFEMMGRLPGVKPIKGKDKFLANMPKTLTAMFPNGLNMKLLTVVAEGPHVAIQAESDTVAGNGKKYANRYHFYFLFEGDRIAQVREYNDVNLVREVFFT
jgi:ketosteroid isomerase-like protein